MSRRRFVGYLGVVGATAALAGCDAFDDSPSPEQGRTRTESSETPTESSETPTEPAPPMSDQFGTVVNLADQGADTETEESIVPLLEEYSGDDTLLYLPSGQYLMDELWRHKRFDNFGLYGDRATIVPPQGYTGALFLLGGTEGSRNCHVEGLHFDFTDPETASPPIIARVEDGLLVRDVSVAGTAGRTQFEVLDPHGTGLVEDLHLPDGGFADAYPPGVYVSELNRGELTVSNASIANYPNNGIYASSSTGPVRVVGGTFENNDISNVRVGDDGLIKDVEIRCTDTDREFRNTRGIWVKGTGATVERCSIRIDAGNSSDGAIVIYDGVTVRDSRIQIDSDDVAAILAKDPEETATDADTVTEPTNVENVAIDGTAANGSAVSVINHDGCVFDGMSVDQWGEDRDGFEFYDVSGAMLRDSTIDVTGTPVIRNQSTVQTIERQPTG